MILATYNNVIAENYIHRCAERLISKYLYVIKVCTACLVHTPLKVAKYTTVILCNIMFYSYAVF